MNKTQMCAALEAMTEWLSHPRELGSPPADIECAGEFDLRGLHYYIFRYRRADGEPWLIGVCGGYRGDGTEHCGHVFSAMEPYEEDTALERAAALAETVRRLWMERETRGRREAGSFAGFVLLSRPEWDGTALAADLKATWGLDGEVREDGQAVLVRAGGMVGAVRLVPAPVPGGEAERNARSNYLWPRAAEAAGAHRAHLLVAVPGQGADLLERGKLFVKLTACCCAQERASGVYTSGTVFEPAFYRELSMVMKEGELPLLNWVWFNLCRREGGVCAYTSGMMAFGMDEMEVLDAAGQPAEVRDFLVSLAGYVLERGVVLQDGETIGFSDGDRHAVTRSEGVFLLGDTLKIAF